MSDRPYDEPAFPIMGGLNEHQFSGLTMRDYFAAKVMHQILRGAVIPHGFDATKVFAEVAARAYEMADAMLVARGQP